MSIWDEALNLAALDLDGAWQRLGDRLSPDVQTVEFHVAHEWPPAQEQQ